MKIVDIIGGLGNQMFGYAFALALQKRFPKETIKLDVSSFGSYGLHNGLEFEQIFGLTFPKASKQDIISLAYYSDNYKWSRIKKRLFPRKKGTCYEFPLHKMDRKALYGEGDKYYEGYWQHYSYFHYYRKDILKAFTFPIPLSNEAEEIKKLILSTKSVCVHIRRGDYLLEKMYRGCCDLDYYLKAINYIKETDKHPHFFIFSNDINWCKDNIIPLLGNNFTIVDCNRGAESYRDMQLMSYGQRLIIANSSFSWWAAYLNVNPDLKVISPILWSNNMKSYDRQLPEWIRM